MEMFANDSWREGFNPETIDIDEVKSYLQPILKLVTELCGVSFTLVNIKDGNQERTLATYGKRHGQEVSVIQGMCERLISEHEVKVVNNLREHIKYKSKLFKSELGTVSFYAGAPLKSESGSRVGSLCLFDSEPRNLTESQKESLQTLADETVLRLQNYQQKKLIEEKNRTIEKQSILLKNSSDITFIIQPESGKIIDVNSDIDSVLGYSPDSLLETSFIDLVESDDVSDEAVKKWFTSEIEKSSRYSIPLRLKNKQNGKRWFECNFTKTNEKWYVTAKDISEKKEAENLAKRHQVMLEELADQISTAIWIRDRDGKHLFVNQNFRELFDLGERKVIGKTVHELFDEDKARQFNENDQKVLESGESYLFDESVKTKAGKRFYKTNIFPISGGKVAGISIDITDEIESREKLESSVEEKETLLKEIHHRVKNNLAVVSGMLHLQWYKEGDKKVQKKLFASTSRIKTMATIHELLYQSSSFTNLKMDENIRRLVDGITKSYEISVNLETAFQLEPIELNINQAIPFSLIINEAVTNVLKHAFKEGESGNLLVSLMEKKSTVTLSIEDNGKGLPEGFDPTDEKDSLGLELIDTLAKQLDAEYSYKSLNEGARFKLTFEKENKKGAGSTFVE